MRKKLNAVEKQYIIDNYDNIQAHIIALKVGITTGGVHGFAKKNHLHKTVRYYNTGRNWTVEDVDFLIKNYEKYTLSNLIEKLNRTKWAIASKKLELKKAGLIT